MIFTELLKKGLNDDDDTSMGEFTCSEYINWLRSEFGEKYRSKVVFQAILINEFLHYIPHTPYRI